MQTFVSFTHTDRCWIVNKVTLSIFAFWSLLWQSKEAEMEGRSHTALNVAQLSWWQAADQPASLVLECSKARLCASPVSMFVTPQRKRISVECESSALHIENFTWSPLSWKPGRHSNTSLTIPICDLIHNTKVTDIIIPCNLLSRPLLRDFEIKPIKAYGFSQHWPANRWHCHVSVWGKNVSQSKTGCKEIDSHLTCGFANWGWLN